MYFEQESAAHKSLDRIVRRLEDLGVAYRTLIHNTPASGNE